MEVRAIRRRSKVKYFNDSGWGGEGESEARQGKGGMRELVVVVGGGIHSFLTLG